MLPAALLVPLPGAVPLGLWAGGAIPTTAAVLAGVVLALMAGAEIGYLRFDVWRCRWLADRLLLADPRSRVSPPLAEWRAAELTSDRVRHSLAGWIDAVLREAERPAQLTWSPLNRAAARQSGFLLRRLGEAVGDVSRPVSPGGILIVRRLLADGTTSPLYRSDRADALPDALTEALAALEALR